MPQVPAVPGTTGLKAAVEAAFADEGPLVRAVEQFEPRDGQRAMAAAVADTLDHGGVLLAEAGTGTGKTLAYLVPAILNRQRVLISTGTKNLQEQIFFKDIPALRTALQVPFSATYMKGRANYLCLLRFESWRDSGALKAADESRYIRLIDEWSRETETGDRAEIEDLPEDSPLWPDIAASAENCIGSDCPRFQDCFVTRMRQRAAESDVVIVNHHLLCADAAVRHVERHVSATKGYDYYLPYVLEPLALRVPPGLHDALAARWTGDRWEQNRNTLDKFFHTLCLRRDLQREFTT